jgi:Lysylphosphatidylglycerol synthase TM region
MIFRDRPRLSVASAIALSIAGILAFNLVAPHELGRQLRAAELRAEAADHTLLLLSIVAFALAPIATGAAWRAALRAAGGRLGVVDACARYGVGSLVNSFTPLRMGDFVRMALFARALPPGFALRGLGAFLALKLARLASLLGLAGIGVGDARLGAAGAGCAIGAIVLARAGRSLTLVALIAASTAARIGAIALVLAAMGVGSPLPLACAIVPALALAGIVPLTPGNVGVAGAAVALSLRASGVGLSDGVPIGIVLHAAESLAGMTIGFVSAFVLGFGRRRQCAELLRRFVTRTSPPRRPRLAA